MHIIFQACYIFNMTNYMYMCANDVIHVLPLGYTGTFRMYIIWELTKNNMNLLIYYLYSDKHFTIKKELHCNLNT